MIGSLRILVGWNNDVSHRLVRVRRQTLRRLLRPHRRVEHRVER
jgi:hypothetical protein